MDYTSAIAELLSRHGFRRFMMSRTGVGHLLLAGRLDGRPIDIVLDTGAGKTFVELNYCRSEGIAMCDTGDPGAPASGAGPGTASTVHTLGDVRLTLEGLATIDLWRSIESLASENWTEDATASALAIPVRQIRKLRLLATVHPAILDQIGAGDMPREQELRTIASATREDQAAVWKKFKPKKGEGVLWRRLSQALDKTRFFARDAKFGEDERAAFGIVWQEDLFAEGDEDNRFTVDGEAFMSAQRAWLDAHMPKNGVLLDVDEYGREKLPPKAQPTWTKPKKGDKIGFAIRPRDGTIHEVVFRMPEPEAKKGKDRSSGNDQDEAPTPKKTRPEITHKGDEIIGALRTDALVKSLEVNAVDDATLIGLLILALNARNVSIQTLGSGRATRTKLVQSITEGGRLSHDVEHLRVVARQTLADVLSCSLGHGDSGLPARIAGDAIGADAHLGNMATEEFLSCLSKTAIERVGSSLHVQPRQRVKDTRAAVIAEAAGSTYIHPAALFALSQAEIAHHSEAPRDYSWAYRDTDDASDETAEETNEPSGAQNDSLEPEPDGDLDNLNSDENAHLDDEDPPIVQERTRARRRHAAAAE
jgi:ParB family chromosome partitioning protein